MESLGGVSQAGEGNSIAQSSNRKRSFSRVVPEQGKKRVNYGKGDARRIMEEAVSLCEAMSQGYEVVLHGRRRSSAANRYVDPSSDSRRRNDPDADLDDSQVAYIARSKRDVAEHFGVAWSTMQPRLVGKIGTKPSTPGRTVSMPDDVELELYNHIVWMCDHGYPVSWDGIKEVAWQLGRICHMPDFVATPQWLKKFKSRFPDLETRYNPQLRNHRAYKRLPGDPGYGDASGEERNPSQVGVAWAELGIGGGLSMAPAMSADLQATTPGRYLAVQRARAEAEAEALRRRQEGVLAGPIGGAAPVHHDPRLHLRPGMMGPLPRHVVGYPNGQLEMTPRYSPLQDSSAVRMSSVWGPGGTGVVMPPPLSHDEMQQQHQQQQQKQTQQPQQQQPPQQHMNFSLQQVGTAGLGSQRLMNVPGQHLINNTISTGGLGSGHLDGSGAHHHALGTATVARSQAISPVAQFAPMSGQSMMMGVGNGGHSQQASAGAPGMVMFPSGGMGGARRLVAPNQATGHAMGMVGPWQAHAPWPEQLVGPWQHPGMSQAPGPPPLQQQQQQQQLQQIISAQGSYQGYHSSTLDPSEAQTRGLSPGVTLPSAQSSSGRSTFATRHEFEVSSDQSTALGSSLGLGLGLGGQLQVAQDEPQMLSSASFGIGGQGSPSLPMEMHQPKREDVNAADGRSRMNIREGPAPIAGALDGLGGSGSGGGYKGNGDGTGSTGKISPSSSYSPAFPTFMTGFCGPVPPGSPRTALVGGVSYPTHLGMGMRGTNEGATKGPPAPGSSMFATARNEGVGGPGGRDAMSGPTTVADMGNSRDGRDPTRHQDSSTPSTQPLHYGGAPDNRSHAEKGKAKRWIMESNGQPSGPTRGIESGNSGAQGRVVERLA